MPPKVGVIVKAVPTQVGGKQKTSKPSCCHANGKKVEEIAGEVVEEAKP